MEQLAQGAAEGIGMKSAGRGKFGCWLQHASGDHGQDEIAIAVGMLVEEAVEMRLAESAEDGGDVTVRTGTDDVEGLRQRSTESSQPSKTARRASTLAGGQWERLAMVRLWTLPFSRKLSRRRIAGGELRLGTTATYM